MKLKTLIDQYINYRRSLGEKIKMGEVYLRLFCRTIGEDILLNKISKKQVSDFLFNKDTITSGWFSKHTALLGFYHYAISRGYINYSPLPIKIPKKLPTFIPYIYSRDELHRIFKFALIYKIKSSWGCIDPYMVRVILILLYCTGLRLSEAISLKIEDVDLNLAIIKIYETKFYKSRLVPFGTELATVLTEYVIWRKRQGSPQNKESPFFINRKKQPIFINTMEYIFKRICKIADIKRMDHIDRHPRMHDLRHTFAVHRLTSWYQEDADVQILLPILSTYMGHTQLSATSIYLTMTNDLLREAGMRFEKYVTGDKR